MTDLLIAAAPGDADEVDPLASRLGQIGWSWGRTPRFSAQEIRNGEIETEADRAKAILVVWSSQSVTDPNVVAWATSAWRSGKLIAVRLDDAVHPIPEVAAFDASMWADGGLSGLQPVIEQLAGKPFSFRTTSNPSPLTPTKRPQRGGAARLWVGALVVATVVAGVAIAADLGLMPFKLDALDAMFATASAPQPDLGATASAAPAASVSSPASSASSPALDASWGATAKDNILQLRAFLAHHASGAASEEAHAAINRLDRARWNEAIAADDASAVLEKLSSYRIDFPDGIFIAEAKKVENEERNRIAEAQNRLSTLGLEHGPADGVSRPSTIAAVKTFEASVGMPPTGRITASLIEALRSKPLDSRGREAEPPAVEQKAQLDAASIKPVSIDLGPAAPRAPFRDCYSCPELVPLPSGSFTMGDASGKGDVDERPLHNVTLNYRLAVGKTEVTFDEWDACVADGGCAYKPDDQGWGRGARPVINIASSDTRQFLGWLTRKTGKHYRLLSESEWEYAARAGGQEDYAFGSDPKALCRYGNGADASSTYAWRNQACSDGVGAMTAEVARYAPNAFGLYDTVGNVWEWVTDCWHESYAGAPSDGSAWTTACDKPDQILRGGAFSVDAQKLRVAYRYSFASQRMPFFGFRVARVLD